MDAWEEPIQAGSYLYPFFMNGLVSNSNFFAATPSLGVLVYEQSDNGNGSLFGLYQACWLE